MGKIDLNFLYSLFHADGKETMDFLKNIGLISSSYICPTCGNQMKLIPNYHSNDGFMWTCRTKKAPAHYVRKSIRIGTWFMKSNLSIHEILLITHFFVSNVQHRFIMNELGICRTTLTEWYGSFKEVCEAACFRMNHPIGGIDKIVEVEEFKFRKSFNRGNHVDVEGIFGGIERGSNKCFFLLVTHRNSETLLNTIKTCILPGSTIVSECWNAYNNLSDEDFYYLLENYSITFKDPSVKVHTNANNSSWLAIKRKLPSQEDKDEFSLCLAEYMWRKYHSSNEDLTRQFFEDISLTYEPKNKDD